MPRIARVVAPGYPHHITQRGTNRSGIFLNDQDRILFLHTLSQWTQRTGTRVWAYCLMDNHFHLLLEPLDVEGLGKCLHGTTFRYAQYFNRKYGRSGRLWENRYFSCPVNKDEYLWSVVRYIERNPVRAKIVERVDDWKWSSGRAHIHGVPDQVINLFEWFDKSERTDYAAFVSQEGEDDPVRRATSTGRPLGSSTFLEILERQLGRSLKQGKRGRPSAKKKGGCP
ncbi:MAG: transposase [Deltaproteobacteria bacterium]|nr:transposase [Deltaproteobacteria bacterium]PIV84878.1 MAG: transposase [Nitrospirae bacterium CG17_big_fil_post_rev_8_21_14_2_50_50_9]PIW85830.1 MAG: transposase [Nitrospirae bacterium CG_4_8_14_3_um_filter_50_41]